MTFYDAYPWLEGLHVASALLFVGGLISETVFLSTLPTAEDLTPAQRRAVSAVRVWDRRLTTPAMLLVWGLGLTLLLTQGWLSAHWLQVKLAFVLALSALHGVQSGTLRRLAGGTGRARKQTVPILFIVICTVCIAVLAVAKPF
jgi:protoporphyrinogen IX oxidase